MKNLQNLSILFVLLFTTGAFGQSTDGISNTINKFSSEYTSIYKNLHASPELSTKEIATARLLKAEISKLGFSVVDSLGYSSFAAVFNNGPGPVILYRTDMDGLPVKEETSFPFASKVLAPKGEETVSVMHACGHDIHMSTWLGTARVLVENKKQWSGTLVFLAQSAEETGQGAKKIVASSFMNKLPKANYQLALHSHATLPSGVVGFCDEYAMAAVDMMTVTIFGKGGHGAAPEKCIDPIVIAAQFINNIQTIVSRNISSNDPAVITVGYIKGGTTFNIIPDKVELKLTIRSYSEENRAMVINRIKTIGNELALAAGMDKDHLPVYDLGDMSIPSLYNNPMLGNELRNILRNRIGEKSYQTVKPVMIGEDFSVYGNINTSAQSYLMWMGTLSAGKKSAADKGEIELVSLHSARFQPDYEQTIPLAMRVMSECIIGLFNKGNKPSKK